MNKLIYKVIYLRLPIIVLAIALLWGYKGLQNKFVQPQAIMVLGGSTKKLEREKFTAKFARSYPNLPILISGGSPDGATKSVFNKAGVDSRRLYLDHEAVDTVSNFTTLVDDLEKRGIKKVYLITSEFHMRRAKVVGEIVLGSRGIDFNPISVPSKQKSEPILSSIRDGIRALLWVATGRTVEKKVSGRNQHYSAIKQKKLR
ncbi:MAG: YdcF family protein [Cyanobacteria bacterium P01_A01_bin.45]